MGPNHTDDSGGWERAGLRQLYDELEAQRALVAQLTMRLGERDAALIRARAELKLREEIALRTAACYAGPEAPLELVHAMRCTGASSVWLTLDDGRQVLARVAGLGQPDEAGEREVYRHLIEAHDHPRSAMCGFSVQAMPCGLFGYAVDDRRREIVVTVAQGREDRRRTRASLAASLKTRRRGTVRPGLLGLLAPVPLLLASMRASARDLLANSASAAASTLTTATATVMVTAVAIGPMPAGGFSFDASAPGSSAQGRQRPVAVAQSAPLTPAPRLSASPRPSVAVSEDEELEPSPETSPVVVPSEPPPLVVEPVTPTPAPLDLSPPPTEPSPAHSEPTPLDTGTVPPVETSPTAAPVPDLTVLTEPPGVDEPAGPPAALVPAELPAVPELTDDPEPAEPETEPAEVPTPAAVPSPDGGEDPAAGCVLGELAAACPAR